MVRPTGKMAFTPSLPVDVLMKSAPGGTSDYYWYLLPQIMRREQGVITLFKNTRTYTTPLPPRTDIHTTIHTENYAHHHHSCLPLPTHAHTTLPIITNT